MVSKRDIEELAQFMRLEPETMDEIMRQVKKNKKKLDGCEMPHDFQPINEDGKKLVRDYRCTKCGGKLDAINTIWYKEGLEHGKE